MSPTARTLAKLKKNGYRAGIVERFCSFSKKRHDWLGFADVLAVHPERPGTLAIQATSGSNLSARVKKIRETEAAVDFLKAGNRIEVWAFSKKGAAGKRKLWTLTARRIAYFDMNMVVVSESEVTSGG